MAVLCHQRTGIESYVRVVPVAMLQCILFVCYDARSASHLCQHETLIRVKEKFWWSGTDVYLYVSSCTMCQARKLVTNARAVPLQPIAPHNEAFDVVSIATKHLRADHRPARRSLDRQQNTSGTGQEMFMRYHRVTTAEFSKGILQTF